MSKGNLRTRIIKKEDIDWKRLQFIQQDGFKEHTAFDKSKLKSSLIENGFADAFNVWQDDKGVLWCLDGYHRKHDLQELVKEGFDVPELLPALFIDCKDKQEAAKLVLIFSSRYATITREGFTDFLSAYDLEFDDKLSNIINLVELAAGADYDEMLPIPSELTAEGKSKPAAMRITFASVDQLEAALPNIEKFLNDYPGAFFSVSAGEI